MDKHRNNKRSIDYLDALYVAEGSADCDVHKGRQGAPPRARFCIEIGMMDKDALLKIQPFFRTSIIGPDKHGTYRISQRGREALRILEMLPRTPLRKAKDQGALRKCRSLWKRGYTDTL